MRELIAIFAIAAPIPDSLRPAPPEALQRPSYEGHPCETPEPILVPPRPVSSPFIQNVKTAIARLIVTQPIGAKVPSSCISWVRHELMEVAVAEELMEEREPQYWWNHSYYIRRDFEELRRRYELFRDWPKVADSSRFPPAHELEKLLKFNLEYRTWLTDQRDMYPVNSWRWWKYEQVYKEASVLYRIYTEACYAVGGYSKKVAARRESLKALRDDYLTPEQYYSGVLPPHVPLRYFVPID